MHMFELFGIRHQAEIHLTQFDGLTAFLAQAVAHGQLDTREFLVGAGNDQRQQQG
ncbi:hypothetical protein D3C76_1380710 [compost metagenome]